MLNNEEKKAIDKLKRSANYFVMPIYETKIILELIEKQSKEIEGLKVDNKKKSIVIIEYQDLYEKLEDKIKAKIEEINKEMLNEENSLELFYRKKYCKEVLQSLLEKE